MIRWLLYIARIGQSLTSISKNLARIADLYELELSQRFDIRRIDPKAFSPKERATEVSYGTGKPDSAKREDEWDDEEAEAELEETVSDVS